jgi:hypothetical protein
LHTFEAADSQSECGLPAGSSAQSSSKMAWASAIRPDAWINLVSFTYPLVLAVEFEVRAHARIGAVVRVG